jgi:hypothetical protein
MMRNSSLLCVCFSFEKKRIVFVRSFYLFQLATSYMIRASRRTAFVFSNLFLIHKLFQHFFFYLKHPEHKSKRLYMHLIK